MLHHTQVIFSFNLLLFCASLNAQVTADFTFSATTGCGSLPVSFCDNSASSAGQIVGWQWDLGGVNVNLQCPSRIFGMPGTYTICLTATDDQGNSDTECKTDLIRVFNLPQPDFEGIPQQGCVPLEVTFSDQSVSVDGTITNWLFGLGGSCGTISGTGATPAAVCTYDVPDSYDVSLTVTDDNGCSNTITKTDYIIVEPALVLDFTADATFGCDPPFTVNFTNNSPPANTTFAWDFGNGDTFSGTFPPPVSYNSHGDFTVSLIAHNTLTGCRDTLELVDFISVGNTASIGASGDEACQGELINFTDNSFSSADSVLWNFGDGNSSANPAPGHRYQAPGCYVVTLTRWVNGCSTTGTYSNCINIFALPDVTYNNNNSIGCSLPHVVNFAGIAQSPDIVSWQWDFGDGNFSNLQNPTHSYTQFGDYPVELTVTNGNGCTFTFSNNPITVMELVADIIPLDVSGCAPQTFTIQDNSFSIATISDWEWTINTGIATYTSSGEQANFTIPDTGIFDVILIVTNSLGCKDTATFTEVVEVGMPPIINFTASTIEECIEVPIDFLDMSSNFAEDWNWQFGDGDEAFSQNTSHSFQDTGFYDITLTATHNGCSNSLTVPDMIHIKEPLAKFDVLQSCDDLFRVEFVDRSVGAHTVNWDFGVTGVDTDTSSLRNPVFVFPTTGSYTVSQTAYNSSTRCSHTSSILVHITVPDAQFSPSVQQGCVPLTVSMIDQSAFAFSWEWTAPGGTISNYLAPAPDITYSAAGKYTDIQLIITDINGCKDTLVFTDTIFVNEITPAFTTNPLTGCYPLTVSLTDNSTNLFSNNNQWNWSFGAGEGTADGANTSYTFMGVDTFPVTLTVRDEWGCVGTLTRDDWVIVARPEANFRAIDSLSCTDHCVRFENLSKGDGLTYLWDFGDGNTSTDANPSNCYSAEGSYTVCLTVTDIFGCDSLLCLPDHVVIADPVASFTADVLTGSCPPLEVNFQNTSQNASSYVWDFGGGTGSSSMENPSQLYTIPGDYTVTLIASSTPNCHDTLVLADFITLNGPIGNITFAIDSSCNPPTITYFGSANSPYYFVWDFGDGRVDTSASQLTADTIVHVYNQPGTYFPTLSLEDLQGCRNSMTVLSGIYISKLEINFQASDTLFCGSNPPVAFSNLSFSSDVPVNFEWLLEGATPAISTDIDPVVNYANPGSFDVALVATSDYCRDTLRRPDYINIGPVPNADFSSSVNQGCEPLDVNFTDNSSVSFGSIDEWNWQFGDGSNSTDQHPAHTFTDDGTLQVTLIATSDVGCADTVSSSIEVFALTPVSAGLDRDICIGEYTLLQPAINGDTTGSSYFWSPGNTLSCTNCLEPLANPIDTTTYTFTFINAEGCVTESPVTINVRPFPAPVIEIIQDTMICAHDAAQLYVSGGNNVFEYSWDESRPGLTCYENCNNPIATPDSTTTYIVTVTNMYGCSSVDSVEVSVLDEYMPFAGADRTICEGDVVTLDASFGSNPVWLNTEGLSCSFCEFPEAAPDSTTTYFVEVVTDIGCTVFDSITVNIVHPDEVDAGEDITICTGTSAILQGVGEGQVSWSPGIGLDDTSILNPEAGPTSSTLYYMTVQNGDCVFTDSVWVRVGDKTDIDLKDLTVCEGDTIELDVAGVADSFNWIEGPGIADPSEASPVFIASQTANYTVVATLSNCAADTASATITVIPAPENNLIPVRYFTPGQTVRLNLGYTPGDNDYEYLWTPGLGLSCESCPNPVVTPDTTSTFTLTVTDPETNCSNKVTTTLSVLESCPIELIGVPNVFSPNNDGNNDELEIVLSPAIKGIFSFRIFDRWGSLVFETADPTEGWDGTFRGKEVREGVYIFLVEAPCELTGQTILKTGDITLIR